MNWFLTKIRFFDTPLLIVSGLLMLLGLAVQYAISLGEGNIGLFYRQLIYSLAGLAVFFLFATYNYQLLAKNNRVVYPLLLLSLVYLLIFGDPIRGSARWIDLGFFQLQPAELAKIIIGIGLARWLYVNRGQINTWSNLFITFLYAGLPAALIFLEPDLGSSLIVMAVWFGIILLSPLKKSYILIFILIGAIFAGVYWQFFIHDYQRQRVEVFLQPDKDPTGKGYNVRQAIIAVGSGQWLGRGLGQGVQSGLKFLPEKHTDFVFAAASEEIGMVGSIAIVVLYFLLLYRLLMIMRRARDELAMYTSGGIFFLFASQALINIAMNIGMLPVTGIPLPFITYGGSSLLVSVISLGIAQNISAQSKVLRF